MGRFYLDADTEKKIKDLIHNLHKEDAPPLWSAWTRDFVESIEEKIQDPSWYPSTKQKEKIEQIWEDMYDE